jgi:hypothetical protein
VVQDFVKSQRLMKDNLAKLVPRVLCLHPSVTT